MHSSAAAACLCSLGFCAVLENLEKNTSQTIHLVYTRGFQCFEVELVFWRRLLYKHTQNSNETTVKDLNSFLWMCKRAVVQIPSAVISHKAKDL